MEDKQIREIIRNLGNQCLSLSEKMYFWNRLISAPFGEESERDDMLREVWNNVTSLPDETTQKALEQIITRADTDKCRITHEKKRKSYIPLQIVAAVVISAVSVITTLLCTNSHGGYDDNIECVVSTGETRYLVLPDNTKVCIGSDSRLVYPKKFRGKTRTIQLTGKANFDVRRDEKHPFIVQTPVFEIKALGTRFDVDVHSDNDVMKTTLEEGVVQVTNLFDRQEKYILNPDERLCYNRHTKNYEKMPVNAKKAMSWKDGELYFVRETLNDILAAIEKKYNKNIINTAPADTNLYTLKFLKDETIENVIKVLTMTIGDLNAEFLDDTIVLSSAKGSAEKGGQTRRGK